MVTVKCPNCSTCAEVPPESIGRQVGCVHCSRVYILSEQYHDTRYTQLLIFNIVLLSIIVVGIFLKIEGDYRFASKSLKAATKAFDRKYDQYFGEVDSSGELSFFDFDTAYGTKADKFKRNQAIVMPQHKGRIVQWQGEVIAIGALREHPYGSFYIKFKQSVTATSDVTIYFREDQAQSLGDIQVGHFQSYQGVIVSAGYGNTDHILKQGKIMD